MPARSIRRIFFAQGLVIGARRDARSGWCSASPASLALGKYQLIQLDPSVYFIDHLPVATEPVDVS